MVIALAVLVLLTLYSRATGPVGRSLAAGLRWVLGDTTAAVAVLVIVLSLRTLVGEGRLAAAKRWGLLLLWLTAATWLSLPELDKARMVGRVGTDEVLGLAGAGRGGGIVGGFVALALLRLLDGIGSEVALGAMALASLVFLTEAATRLAFARLVGGLLALGGRGAIWLAHTLAGAVILAARGVAAFFTPDAPREEGRSATRPASATRLTSALSRPAAPSTPRLQPPAQKTEAGFGSGGPKAAERPAPPAVEEVEETERPVREEEPPAIRPYVSPIRQEEKGSVRGPEPGEGAVAVHGTQLALLAGQAMYQLPPLSLLSEPVPGNRVQPVRNLAERGRLLEDTLESFGVKAKVVQIDQGPVVTRFELQPAPGVKVSRIVSLADDLALSLAAADVRIEAPIPGKAAVGIEVPNKEVAVVHLREILAAPEFASPKVRLPLALGKDIAGTPIVCDLVDMPHLLIAGATGSGKSVCLNTMVASLLYRLRPDEVKLLMIDPKRVELAVYDGIPHLLAPVVTDPKKAAVALKWVVEEMEKRYELFASNGVRNIDKYNALMLQAAREAAAAGEPAGDAEAGEAEVRPLPYVIVLIDELADLMMVAAAEVEDSICRLAQMARAAGIHLVIATQRPSVDVITGLIKANIPSRVAFAVSSQVDSRTILDMAGAERLLGKGDMLFCPVGAVKPLRVQGAYMTDREVEGLVGFWKRQGRPEYQANLNLSGQSRSEAETGDDELYDDAVKLVVSTGNASISMIQRRFRIGYARAARLIDMMELAGVVGPYQGSKPREVLVSAEEEQ